MEGECKKSLFASIHKPATDDGRPRSMVVKVNLKLFNHFLVL